MAEQRKFQMHEKLLRDVIKRQAGTLEKAVLEGVMNSVEAGASKVEVAVSAVGITIIDDGKGFRDREEVEKFFETFGQPHDESEGKKWAQFRMGRGQMFAFGVNVWRTGEFRMTVDVDRVLGYDLEEGLMPYHGCHIDISLYQTLTDRQVWEMQRAIEKYVKYVSVPVVVNGKTVSSDPSKVKNVTGSDDVALYRLEAGDEGSQGITVYNMGVYVMDVPRWKYGVGGLVISKKKLDVNFARNDVMSSCPVWRKIMREIRSSSEVKDARKKKRLSAAERASLIADFCSGGPAPEGQEWSEVKLLVDVTGRAWSAEEVVSTTVWSHWTTSRRNVMADKVMQYKVALVLDELVLEGFHYDGETKDFIGWFVDRADASGWRFKNYGIKWMDFEDASDEISGENFVVNKDELTPTEHAWLRVADKMQGFMYSWREKHQWHDREIKIGESQTAAGWTNGQTYVALSRNFLKRHVLWREGRPVVRSIVSMAHLLAHEFCHDDDSQTQTHGLEFYQAYHDLSSNVERAISRTISWLTPKEHERVMRVANKAHQAGRKRLSAARKKAEKKAEKKVKVAARKADKR